MLCFREGYVPMGKEISPWKIRSFIQGDPACWLGVVDHSACCNPAHGSEGNAICWGASFSFKQCCAPWQQIKEINERKQQSWRNFVEATMWGMILECGYSVPLLVPKVRRSYLDPCLNWRPFFEGCFYIHFLTKFQTNDKQNRNESRPQFWCTEHASCWRKETNLAPHWPMKLLVSGDWPMPLRTSATSTKLFWFCTKCIFDSRSIGDCKGHSSCTNLGAARMMFSPLMFFLSGRWYPIWPKWSYFD